MKVRRNFLLGALLGLIVGGLLIWIMANATPYEKTVDSGPSDAAKADPYLAAEGFLIGRGLTVDRIGSLGLLPEAAGGKQTLLLLGDRRAMSQLQVDKLLAWTQAGGGLLVVASANWNEKTKSSGDLLLDGLQIERYLSADLKDDSTGKPDADQTDAYPTLTKFYLENEKAPAYAAFDTRFHLYDAGNQADAWANSAAATHMLHMPYGDGWITVVSDAGLWNNGNIGRYDNAWLLWYLAQDSHVTLWYAVDQDNLFKLLLQYFPEALLTLAMLIALSLWAAALRQGPLVPSASGGRREWREHLRASADFLMRRSGQAVLLQALQQDVLRRARRRHPGFERLTIADQWQVLSRLTRQPTSAISQALRPRPQQRLSSVDFSRQVAHLQTLRNAL